jgi:hypothetical protein
MVLPRVCGNVRRTHGHDTLYFTASQHAPKSRPRLLLEIARNPCSRMGAAGPGWRLMYNHFILIVRLSLPTLLLTSNSLSLILTLTLVRPESFLCFLLGAYRDCFHGFLSLCVFLCFTRGGLVTHNLSSLPGLAFFFCNQLDYGRLVIRRAVEMATLGS